MANLRGDAASGVAGADQKCQDAADKSSHLRVKGRSFLAWVSTSQPGQSPSSRFAHGTARYALPAGEGVSDNWTLLIGPPLGHAIDQDENGVTIIAARQERRVWTGTNDNGTSSEVDCLKWEDSTSLVTGTVGFTDATTDLWTSHGGMGCAAPLRLYCFER